MKQKNYEQLNVKVVETFLLRMTFIKEISNTFASEKIIHIHYGRNK
jgi:hypothetical protein